MMLDHKVRLYAPDHWGEVERFSKFYEGTFNLRPTTKRAVSGVINHFNKALIFLSLANRIKPNLFIDSNELRENGFTPASNSREFTAVIEEIFTELFSSVDCTCEILFALHENCRGLPDSTRKMFERVKAGKVEGNFPEELKKAIIEADWFLELLSLRDELTHFNTGNCSLDPETGLVSYMHHGIKRNKNILILEDVLSEIDKFINGVNAFHGEVFHFLNSKLKDEPTIQLCGMFFGRAYARQVSPFDTKDFHGGKCFSHTWFETLDGYMCPLATECGAYASVKKA